VGLYPGKWESAPRLGWGRWPIGSNGLIGDAVRARSRLVLVCVGCALPILWAWQVLLVWNIPDEDLQDPWGDAVTYLAAGERLNDGHALYSLSVVDRRVLMMETYTAPLLSPPPIAAIWRPLAAIPFGMAIWVGACWVALLGTIGYLVMRLGLPAAVVVAALSWPIGEQLAAANVSAFFPGLLLLAWLKRDGARWGAMLGAMAALKLAPGVMVGWWVGRHRGSGVLAFLAGAASLGLVGLVGAGIHAYIAYASIPGTTEPSSLSVAGRLGASWFPYLAITLGGLMAAALGRFPRLSFSVAYLAMLVGTPAVYVADFGLLIGFLIPFVRRSEDESVALLIRERSDGEGVRPRFRWNLQPPGLRGS
jgi:Glycosyltransferase family 87